MVINEKQAARERARAEKKCRKKGHTPFYNGDEMWCTRCQDIMTEPQAARFFEWTLMLGEPAELNFEKGTVTIPIETLIKLINEVDRWSWLA